MADMHNPYAPPAATVADITPDMDGKFQPIKMFSAQGRIGRMRFYTYFFVANFIVQTVGSMIGLIVGIIAAVAGASEMGMLITMYVIVGLSMIPFMVYYVLIGIQRSHDLNLSGWTVLLTFIPFVMLYWLFAPGTDGPNRFGAPPPPNSTGVQVVFWIGIGLAVLGLVFTLIAIVAAIAIPGLMQQ
jgi:uncharacterized membrane protein YhaH (DUF805 family)